MLPNPIFLRSLAKAENSILWGPSFGPLLAECEHTLVQVCKLALLDFISTHFG